MTSNALKLTQEKKEKFLKQYENSHSITASAEAIGVTKQAIYYQFKNDAEFKRRKDAIEDKVLDAVENALYTKAITNKDVTAMIFILCNRRPEGWRNLRETKHAFSDEVQSALDKIAKLLK